MEKSVEIDPQVEEKDTSASTEIVEKRKARTGLYFSDIPKEVRVSEFKNALRDRDVKLVFVKWKAFKQSAIVFFEDDLDVVTKNLSGMTLQEETVKYEEIIPKAGDKEPMKRSPRNRGDRKPKRESENMEGRRRKTVSELEADKGRKRVNRKDQRIKRREEYGGQFGIFVGKIPKGVTKEDLGHQFSTLNVPLPDYVDWVVKKGHAFAFWNEVDASLSLEAFTGITVGGVTLQVELYNTERPRRERKREDREEGEEREEGERKYVERKERAREEKSPKAVKKEPKSENEKPIENTKPKMTEEDAKKKSSASPKKPVVNDKAAKSVAEAPKTPTKTKVSGSGDSKSSNGRSPTKSTTTPTKSSGRKVPEEGGEGGVKADSNTTGKENCSIS